MSVADLQKEVLSFKLGRSKLFNRSKTGNVRLSKTVLASGEFKRSSLFANIMQSTKFLTTYGIKHKVEISMKHRICAIFQDITSVPVCSECNKRDCTLGPVKSFSQPLFSSVCQNSVCHAKHAVASKGSITKKTRRLMSDSAKASKRTILDSLVKLYESCDDIDAEKDACIKYCKEHAEKNQHVSANDIKLYPSIIGGIFQLTKFIEVKIPVKSKLDLALDDRLYCIANGISTVEKCQFCQTRSTKFISLKKGYSDVCTSPLCISDKIRQVKGQKTSKQLIAEIEASGDYEVISFPVVQGEDPLVVKCNKCGNISKHFLYNGALQHPGRLKLCNFCDAYSSEEERKLVSFIQQLATQQMLVHDRALIAPNELDVYLPNAKLAIEYDGFYWHNADVKSSYYHMMKTKLCAEYGVDLIHIFENEVFLSPDAVYDALKRHLAQSNLLYVSAKLCEVKKIGESVARDFATKNMICDLFLKPGELNYGLFQDGNLVSLLSASLMSSSACKIICHCDKIGINVAGSLHKLLCKMQENYHIRDAMVHINARWPILADEYAKEGFQCQKITGIRALFYNASSRSANKNLLNKKQMRSFLGDSYVDSFSLRENAVKAKWKCIYDCGDIVLVKKL